MRIYEHVPQEIDEVLPFRNAMFTSVSKAHWEAMNCTAVVARDGDELVGFIPLQFREQCLNARVSIPVVYENAVGVAEGRRSQGIGSQMIEEAARFISDRADALMVVRGGERSEGYRFYRKTGHGDLMYAHWYRLPPEISWPPADAEGISVLDREQWLALESDLLALYESQYGRFGGGQLRRPGYWRTILEGHVLREHRWWFLTLTSDQGRLVGYLVAVQGTWRPSEDVYIYEAVGQDEDVLERLIRYARRFAANAIYGAALVSKANPIRGLLRRMGFTEEESTPHVMARILRPDRIFGRLAAGSDLTRTLSLTLSTPHRTVVVNAPPDARYTVRLETKEGLLSRLFCCRLDLAAALDMELVRWNEQDPGLERELCRVFELAEWVQWFTDFV